MWENFQETERYSFPAYNVVHGLMDVAIRICRHPFKFKRRVPTTRCRIFMGAASNLLLYLARKQFKAESLRPLVHSVPSKSLKWHPAGVPGGSAHDFPREISTRAKGQASRHDRWHQLIVSAGRAEAAKSHRNNVSLWCSNAVVLPFLSLSLSISPYNIIKWRQSFISPASSLKAKIPMDLDKQPTCLLHVWM